MDNKVISGLKKTVALSLSGVVAFLILGGVDSCNPPLNKDPGFDIWCGDALCAWKIEAGEIARVPTWHRSDYGVSLVGSRVVLSQLFSASSKDTTCFEITLQADTDPGVELEISFDFFDDGTTDYVHPLISDHFDEVTYKLRAPTYFDGVRLRIVKRGVGRAVLARIRIARGSGCDGTPLESGARPLGVVCERHDQCSSGYCVETLQSRGPEASSSTIWAPGPTWRSRCSSCATDGDCVSSQICGQLHVASKKLHAFGSWYRACVAPKSKGLAERCAEDAECATGICCLGICSTCCPASGEQAAIPCQGGGRCAQRFPSCAGLSWCESLSSTLGSEMSEMLKGHLSAWQCDPEGKKSEKEEVCLRDADCQSGRCLGEGTLRQCLFTGERCVKDVECGSFLSGCLPIGELKGHCQ